jgi:hypothetical protein
VAGPDRPVWWWPSHPSGLRGWPDHPLLKRKKKKKKKKKGGTGGERRRGVAGPPTKEEGWWSAIGVAGPPPDRPVWWWPSHPSGLRGWSNHPLCHPSSFTFFFSSLTGGGPATPLGHWGGLATTKPAGLVVAQPPQWPKGWPATPYGWIGHLFLSPFFFLKKKKKLDLKI